MRQQNQQYTELTISPKADINPDAIPDFLETFGGAITFKTDKSPTFVWRVIRKKYSNNYEYLHGLKDVINLMNFSLTN